MSGKEDREAVARLARLITIRDCRPLAFSAQLEADVPPPTARIHVSVHPRVSAVANDGGFSVLGTFMVGLVKEGPERFAKFRYRVVTEYSVEGALPAPRVLQAFAETNGMVHLWPYLRAFVQGACGQLGVPPIQLPIFRISLIQPIVDRAQR